MLHSDLNGTFFTLLFNVIPVWQGRQFQLLWVLEMVKMFLSRLSVQRYADDFWHFSIPSMGFPLLVVQIDWVILFTMCQHIFIVVIEFTMILVVLVFIIKTSVLCSRAEWIIGEDAIGKTESNKRRTRVLMSKGGFEQVDHCFYKIWHLVK